MPAYSATIVTQPRTPLPASNGPVLNARIQNAGNYPVFLIATLTNVPPADRTGYLKLQRSEVIDAERPLSAWFPSFGYTPIYLWIDADSVEEITVNHA